MVSKIKKLLAIGLVLVTVATVFSVAVTNVSACKDKEKEIESLKPNVATDGYIHIVWQENLTGNFEIYYVNNATGNYGNILTKAIEELANFKDGESKKALKNLNESLNKYIAGDYKHSIDKAHEAIKNLEKAKNTVTLVFLIDAIRDFAKTNILYVELELSFNNSYIQEAYQKYYLGLEKYNEANYDATINQFKNSFLKLIEAYEAIGKTYTGFDFGKIVRISYTNFDSVNPQIFLNGTINVGWIEKTDVGDHVYYARSTNNGVTWWYFDATQYATPYLDYWGIEYPETEPVLEVMSWIRIISWSHYIYGRITYPPWVTPVEYAPVDDPYHNKYLYDTFSVGDDIFHIPRRCPLPDGEPPKAPDLIVTEVNTTPLDTSLLGVDEWNYPVTSSPTPLYACIENIGNAEVSGILNVVFYEDTTNLGSYSFSHLGCGVSAMATIQWIPSTAGIHTMKAVVDPENNVAEGNESNNELSEGINVLAHDGDEDTDGLTNYKEVYVYGTNPYNPDTDADGLSDGDEVNVYSTRPTKYDSDNDGLVDSEETYVWETVKENGDGTLEGYCALFVGDINWAPEIPVTVLVDFQPTYNFDVRGIIVHVMGFVGNDYGCLVDIYIGKDSGDFSSADDVLVKDNWDPEWIAEDQVIILDKIVSVTAGTMYTLKFITDSTDNDTHDDYLYIGRDESPTDVRIGYPSDGGLALTCWANIGILTYWTNPNNPDTDGDGLKDGEEVSLHYTNPKNMDSDGDGINDGAEVRVYYSNPTKETTYIYTDSTRKKLIDAVSGPEKEFATKTPYVDGRYALTEPYMDEFRLSTYAPYAVSGGWTTHLYPVSASTTCTFYVHITLFDQNGNTNFGEYITSISLVDVNGIPVSVNIICSQISNGKYYGDIVVEASNKPSNTDYMLSWCYSATSTTFAGIKINTDYTTVDTARILYVCPEATLIGVKVKGVPPDTVDINTYMKIIDPDADGTKDLFFRGHRVGYTASMSLDTTDITNKLKTAAGNYLYISGNGAKSCPFSYNIGPLPNSAVHTLSFVWRIIKNTGGCFQYYIGEDGWDPYTHDLDNDHLTDAKEADYNFAGNGLHDQGTDPNNPDTDGDGSIDGEEANLYSTNALASSDYTAKWALIAANTPHSTHIDDGIDFYNMLINDFGFRQDHVILLLGDIDNTHPAVTEDNATSINITDNLTLIASNVDSNDLVVIYLRGHGGYATGYEPEYYCTYDYYAHGHDENYALKDDTLALKINALPCNKIALLVDACYSGGFFRDDADRDKSNIGSPSDCALDAGGNLATNRVCTSSQDEDSVSYCHIFTPGIINGFLVYGDQAPYGNADGVTSIEEAFNYCYDYSYSQTSGYNLARIYDGYVNELYFGYKISS